MPEQQQESRPPIGRIESAEVARFEFQLSEELKTDLEQEARRRGESAADFVRQAIALYLGREWGKREAAKDLASGVDITRTKE